MSDADDVFRMKPIGIVRSPHTRREETPIQPVFASGAKGTVEVLPDYEEGLTDLDGFSHIYLIYVFHQHSGTKLRVRPFLDDTLRGVFATRAPCRPNHIGLSIVRLKRRDGNVLHVEDVDILDGTPVLDIKPYSTRFDARPGSTSGWLDEVDEDTARKRGSRRGDRKE